MSALSLRLPESLHNRMTEDYLQGRAQRGRRAKYVAALNRVADVEPEEQDPVMKRSDERTPPWRPPSPWHCPGLIQQLRHRHHPIPGLLQGWQNDFQGLHGGVTVGLTVFVAVMKNNDRAIFYLGEDVVDDGLGI
jgi:hypothetical protein